jgi:hypothetical protein
MVQLINTKTNYKIILKKNKSIKVRDVYNSLFFSSFGLEKARVFSKEQNLNESNSEDTDLKSLSSDSTETDDVDNEDGYFFKERTPSGYSDLPLFKKDVIQDDGTVIQEKDVDSNDGVYAFLNDYISNYTGQNKEKSIGEDEIYILVPFEVENPIITLSNFSIPDKNELLMIAKNGITYNVFEKIVYDIYLQIIYLQEKGYYYNEIPLESVLLINNRYIILSIETVSNFSDNDNNNELFIKAFLMFLEKLFKDDTLESVLEKIQYTNLYYFIKRAQNENILLFIK